MDDRFEQIRAGMMRIVSNELWGYLYPEEVDHWTGIVNNPTWDNIKLVEAEVEKRHKEVMAKMPTHKDG